MKSYGGKDENIFNSLEIKINEKCKIYDNCYFISFNYSTASSYIYKSKKWKAKKEIKNLIEKIEEEKLYTVKTSKEQGAVYAVKISEK